MRQILLWIADHVRQDVADARAEHLEREHLFPVSNRETDPVIVYGDDAGVHLTRISIRMIIVNKGGKADLP